MCALKRDYIGRLTWAKPQSNLGFLISADAAHLLQKEQKRETRISKMGIGLVIEQF